MSLETAELFDSRDAYAATLQSLAREDPRIAVVVNDSVGSSKLGPFGTQFGERLINVGIAEQTQVGLAAGLENSGMIPIVSCAGSFLSARATEQIKADIAYSNRHVILCAMSPGMAYGQLGATHHSIEDVAWMRILPNMTVFVPSDPIETEQIIRWAVEHEQPAYIRVPRMKIPRLFDDAYRFEAGRAAVLREGGDITLVANGTVAHRALAAAEALAAEGVSARVLAMASVKPLDEEAIVAAARETRGIVTAEEGFAAGGLGGAVAEVVTRTVPTRIERIGVPDEFAFTGSADRLMDEYGISADGIAQAARRILEG